MGNSETSVEASEDQSYHFENVQEQDIIFDQSLKLFSVEELDNSKTKIICFRESSRNNLNRKIIENSNQKIFFFKPSSIKKVFKGKIEGFWFNFVKDIPLEYIYLNKEAEIKHMVIFTKKDVPIKLLGIDCIITLFGRFHIKKIWGYCKLKMKNFEKEGIIKDKYLSLDFKEKIDFLELMSLFKIESLKEFLHFNIKKVFIEKIHFKEDQLRKIEVEVNDKIYFKNQEIIIKSFSMKLPKSITINGVIILEMDLDNNRYFNLQYEGDSKFPLDNMKKSSYLFQNIICKDSYLLLTGNYDQNYIGTDLTNYYCSFSYRLGGIAVNFRKTDIVVDFMNDRIIHFDYPNSNEENVYQFEKKSLLNFLQIFNVKKHNIPSEEISAKMIFYPHILLLEFRGLIDDKIQIRSFKSLYSFLFDSLDVYIDNQKYYTDGNKFMFPFMKSYDIHFRFQ